MTNKNQSNARDEVLKRMLKMPPKPHLSKKSDNTAEGGKKRKVPRKGASLKAG